MRSTLFVVLAGLVALASAYPVAATEEELLEKIKRLEETVEAIEQRQEFEDGEEFEDPFESGADLTVKGFTHFGLGAENLDTDGASSNSNEFALGGLDLFIFSRLSNRITFLNETVFEPTAEGENVLDVERVIVKYVVNDALNIQAGRFHTTLGYWNETFHHGEWIQTSIGRPAVFAFEDDGGVLPIHLVGALVNGSLGGPGAHFEYKLEAGNGRGPTPDPPQITTDGNNTKAINLALRVAPRAVSGLRIGASAYFDKIPENTDGDAGPLHGSIDEQIMGLFVSYTARRLEVLAEYLEVEHKETGRSTTNSKGYYVQAARKFGSWTPYFRYDAVELDDRDRYFSNLDDVATFAVGCRWDMASWSALKFQVSTQTTELSTGGSDVEATRVTLQNAIAF